MKVLVINTVPTEKNGITNVIFNIITSSHYENVDFGYVSINKPNDYHKKILIDFNIKLHVIPRKISNPLKYILTLAKVAKNYDIIHVHGNSATMVLEMIAAKMAGIKVRIAHSHNTTCSMKAIDKLARPLFYKLCNGRMACGIEAGKWLFGKRKFIVLNNGINSKKFIFNPQKRDLIRKNFDIHDEIVIGHVGNFVEQKNHRFLIDIFYRYHNLNNNSKLLLLGDGPLKKECKDKVKTLGISDCTIFAGSVENPSDYLNAMDLIVMPSLFEGLPLTLVEEQANGLNILSADTITKDANMTGLIKYLSLTDNAETWAQEIRNISESIRRISYTSSIAIKKIKNAGYDIILVSQKLNNYYFHELYNR